MEVSQQKGDTALKHCNLIRTALAVAILAAFAPSYASAASFTAVNTGSVEPSVFYFLDAIYGAGNYERISDDLDGVWIADDIIGITAVGKQSDAKERLGVCLLCDGTDNFQFGSTVSPNGILSMSLFDGLYDFGGSTFRWYDAAFDNPAVGTVYSDTSLNANGTDQMVSFAIKDRPGVFVIAFEDWLSSYTHGVSDRDFNDFIVEVRFATRRPNLTQDPPTETIPSVPEPAGFALLGGALLVLGLARRSRSRVV